MPSTVAGQLDDVDASLAWRNDEATRARSPEFHDRPGSGSTILQQPYGLTATTAHLSMTASLSDAEAAPGERLSIVADITPAPAMHVYAPGTHSYQMVRLEIDPQPWLKVHPTTYPPSTIYHFAPLDERVEVYMTPFRLRRDVTLLATPEAQKLLGALSSASPTGVLEYQACDDKVCFNPARVPISFVISVQPLDRRPPG